MSETSETTLTEILGLLTRLRPAEIAELLESKAQGGIKP